MHSEIQINKLFDTLRAEREVKIAAVMQRPDPEIQAGGRMIAAIIVDTEQSTTSTNAKMLKMIGVDVKKAPLQEIIDGLALWNIFLTGTNHLTDEKLRYRLVTTVLKEEIQLVPPSPDMSEFVDLGGGLYPNPNGDDDTVATPQGAGFDRDSTLPRPMSREAREALAKTEKLFGIPADCN